MKKIIDCLCNNSLKKNNEIKIIFFLLFFLIIRFSILLVVKSLLEILIYLFIKEDAREKYLEYNK